MVLKWCLKKIAATSPHVLNTPFKLAVSACRLERLSPPNFATLADFKTTAWHGVRHGVDTVCCFLSVTKTVKTPCNPPCPAVVALLTAA
jgi:hypothetical protein